MVTVTDGHVVNSVGDAGDATPGDGTCFTGGTVASQPECTLRAAMEEAEASPGTDTIAFGLPPVLSVAPGVYRMSPGSPYPLLTEPVVIDAYRPTVRFEVLQEFEAENEGTHTLSLISSSVQNPDSIGSVIAVGNIEVLPPVRTSDMGVILGMLGAVVGAGVVLALLLGRRVNAVAERLTTKRTILLTLAVYTGIVVWGYFLDTVIEFWFLAWAVAIVQGGSQALSRSLYATMAPASQSGEFFGFFTAVARFGAVIGPLLFAAAVAVFGSSRPAVASLAVLFILGGLLLSRVDEERGRLTAAYHDLTALSYPRHVEGGLANYGRPESLPEAAQGFRERIRSLDRGQVTGLGDDEEL